MFPASAARRFGAGGKKKVVAEEKPSSRGRLVLVSEVLARQARNFEFQELGSRHGVPRVSLKLRDVGTIRPREF